jgi:hypothetical protein
MILTLNSDSFYQRPRVICLRAPVDLKTFLQRAKVAPRTYAGELLSNLYTAIFNHSLELIRDYRIFYSFEYATFVEYLGKRLLIEKDAAVTIAAEFSRSRQIIYFKPNYSFLAEDYGQEFLERLLEPRRTK